MAWVRTVDEHDATDQLKERYETDLNQLGFVMESTKALSIRPELGDAYEDFWAALRRSPRLSERERRLINLLVADRIGSTYCVLVYASHLERDLGGPEGIRAFLRDHHGMQQLSEREVAILDYALAAALGHPRKEHVDRLRDLRLDDETIVDVAVTACLRLLGSRVYDALGVEADPFFSEQTDLLEAVEVSEGRRA